MHASGHGATVGEGLFEQLLGLGVLAEHGVQLGRLGQQLGTLVGILIGLAQQGVGVRPAFGIA